MAPTTTSTVTATKDEGYKAPKRRNSWSGAMNGFSLTAEDKVEKVAKKQSRYVRFKYSYLPTLAIIVDVFQFTLLPWNLSLKWPSGWMKVLEQITRIFFFQWLDFDLGVGYEACQYMLAGFALIMLGVLKAPAQKLDLAFGSKIMGFIWFFVTAMQTVLFMPSLKFAMTGFGCTRIEKALDDNDACGSGRHVGLILACALSSSTLYFGAIRFAQSLFTPLEVSKRSFAKMTFAQTTPVGTYATVTTKLILSATLFVLKEVVQNEFALNVSTSLICIAALASLTAGINYILPYKNQLTQSAILSLLAMCTTSNFMGFINALVDSGDNSLVALAWLLVVPLSWTVLFPIFKYRSRANFNTECLKAEDTQLLKLSNIMQGALPEAFLDLLTRLSGPTKIESVDCSKLYLKTSQIQQLSAAMASNYNASFKLVNLSSNKMSGVGHGIDLLIRKSETIHTLILDDNELPPGIPVICLALSRNQSLKTLSLANCHLNERAGVNLAKALKENTSLEDLNLSKNCLGVEGGKALAEGLKDANSLKKLNVSWNQMGVDGLKPVLEALGDVDITMICNGVPNADWEMLKSVRKTAAEPAGDAGPTLDELFKSVGVTSIYDLIGKVLNLPPEVALHALCEEFYLRLVSDQMLVPFFSRVSMGRMRNLQKTCLTEALGGPSIYKGMDLKAGHAHLKIDDDVYDATIAHLFGAVLKFIPAPPGCVVKALVDLTEALRPLVVNTELDKKRRVPTAEDISSGSAAEGAVDETKAKPFFSGAAWKTGMFSKRNATNTHPALDVRDDYGSGICCCPMAGGGKGPKVAAAV
jgi:truncated hemoglobin YjbI